MVIRAAMNVQGDIRTSLTLAYTYDDLSTNGNINPHKGEHPVKQKIILY